MFNLLAEICQKKKPENVLFTDGMGWMGWMDGRNIKSVLQYSSYFVGIYIRYIPTYIDNKKLSPTFLWVSKFDVKLGVGVKSFKFTAGR